MDVSRPLGEVNAAYRAETMRLAAESENVTLDLKALRQRYFLAWDDDGGEGYAALLEYTIPAPVSYTHLDVYKRQPQYVEVMPPAAPDPAEDIITQLERLGALRAQGILTEEEFAAQKARLMGM